MSCALPGVAELVVLPRLVDGEQRQVVSLRLRGGERETHTQLALMNFHKRQVLCFGDREKDGGVGRKRERGRETERQRESRGVWKLEWLG